MERKSIYNYKNIILKIEKIVSDIKREPVKILSAATLGAALIASGCDATNVLKTVSPTDSPLTSSSTIKPSPTPELTVEQTIEPTLEPSIEPTATPEVILSSKGDVCRVKDPGNITKHELEHDIHLGYIRVGDTLCIGMCIERPSKEEGKDIIIDYWTNEWLFEAIRDVKRGTITRIPLGIMKEKGDVEYRSFDSLYGYLTEELKVSSEEARKEIDNIKTGKDLREWYERRVPVKQRIVIPWEHLVGIKSDDYVPDFEVWCKTLYLEDSRKANKIVS